MLYYEAEVMALVLVREGPKPVAGSEDFWERGYIVGAKTLNEQHGFAQRQSRGQEELERKGGLRGSTKRQQIRLIRQHDSRACKEEPGDTCKESKLD